MYKKGRVNSNSRIISTDEDPSLRIESSAIINLRGVSTKLNKYIVIMPVLANQLHFLANRNAGVALPPLFFNCIKIGRHVLLLNGPTAI